MRINGETGRLAQFGDTNVILEAFRLGSEPFPGENGTLVLDNGFVPFDDALRSGLY